MSGDERVPAAARLVRDFVNTREPQVDAELLTTPAALREWLREQKIGMSDGTLTEADLAAAIQVREGFRAVLLSHAGHAADPAAVAAMNQTLDRLPVRLRFGEDDYRLTSTTEGMLAVAVAELLDAVRRSREDGSWPRLKVCARSTCRWAFFDASRNQVRRWCSMAGCGNHVKMQRAYATRKRREQSASPP